MSRARFDILGHINASAYRINVSEMVVVGSNKRTITRITNNSKKMRHNRTPHMLKEGRRTS
ncbi:hypothetical protein [Candidatus Nitrososphaera evergladensis]|uniref:hypothetical protein n=1 Tax=Candidatus Nitrososphaera evergladensis TaxID=1459637 RepID=UPI0011E60827|nr:hypothetical protein [Candidatus Nitrososphaera evergladensis]